MCFVFGFHIPLAYTIRKAHLLNFSQPNVHSFASFTLSITQTHHPLRSCRHRKPHDPRQSKGNSRARALEHAPSLCLSFACLPTASTQGTFCVVGRRRRSCWHGTRQYLALRQCTIMLVSRGKRRHHNPRLSQRAPSSGCFHANDDRAPMPSLSHFPLNLQPTPPRKNRAPGARLRP